MSSDRFHALPLVLELSASWFPPSSLELFPQVPMTSEKRDISSAVYLALSLKLAVSHFRNFLLLTFYPPMSSLGPGINWSSKSDRWWTESHFRSQGLHETSWASFHCRPPHLVFGTQGWRALSGAPELAVFCTALHECWRDGGLSLRAGISLKPSVFSPQSKPWRSHNEPLPWKFVWWGLKSQLDLFLTFHLVFDLWKIL